MVKIKVILNDARNIELIITTTKTPYSASLIEIFLSKTKPKKTNQKL